jgi:hypothetical protein
MSVVASLAATLWSEACRSPASWPGDGYLAGSIAAHLPGGTRAGIVAPPPKTPPADGRGRKPVALNWVELAARGVAAAKPKLPFAPVLDDGTCEALASRACDTGTPDRAALPATGGRRVAVAGVARTLPALLMPLAVRAFFVEAGTARMGVAEPARFVCAEALKGGPALEALDVDNVRARCEAKKSAYAARRRASHALTLPAATFDAALPWPTTACSSSTKRAPSIMNGRPVSSSQTGMERKSSSSS